MKKWKVILFISNWPSQQHILSWETQTAINVKSNIKDRQALLSAKLSKKTLDIWTFRKPQQTNNRGKPEINSTMQPIGKVFYALKGHEEGGDISSVPQKIRKKYFTLVF